jgi:excisionase family DNA binding protein
MWLVVKTLANRKAGRKALLQAASAIALVDVEEPEAGDVSAATVDIAALEAASGGMLTSPEVAERLNQTRQNVSEMLKSQRILGVRFGTRWRFPAIQFRRREVLPGLPAVIQGMGGLDQWQKLGVLLSLDKPEERRPLQLLLAGDRTRALTAASRAAAQVAHASGTPIRRTSGSKSLDKDLEADLRRDRDYDAIEPFAAET